MEIERREFLGINGAGSLAGHIGRLLPAERQLPSIGLQFCTVRGALRRDFDGTLQKVPVIGYGEVEFAGYLDHTPKEVTPFFPARDYRCRQPTSIFIILRMTGRPHSKRPGRLAINTSFLLG